MTQDDGDPTSGELSSLDIGFVRDLRRELISRASVVVNRGDKPTGMLRVRGWAVAASVFGSVLAIGLVWGLFLSFWRTDPAHDAIPPPGSLSAPAVSEDEKVHSVRLCDEVEWPEAPSDWYRDEPVYVDPQSLSVEVGRYAASLPGFEVVWGNAERNNWIHVGFADTDIAARQRELEAEFPGEGIVAVELDYTSAEIEALGNEVELSLPPDMSVREVDHVAGIISIWVGVLTEDSLTQLTPLSEAFPVCADGRPVDKVVTPGPQQSEGSGWRYLGQADVEIGRSARIVTFEGAFADLWDEMGMAQPTPQVDWVSHIVVAFEMGYGGSNCDETRFDGIAVEDRLLHAVIVDPTIGNGPPKMCDLVYLPRVYVVAIDRSFLPAPPFTVKTAPEYAIEVTVDVDLRYPSSVVEPAPPFVRE